MGKVIDLTNRKFGRLTVISLDHFDNRKEAWWLCKCSCGNLFVTRSSLLRDSRTKSCGCLKKEMTSSLFKGKPLSNEHKKKLSEIKLKIPCKIAGWNKGKPRSREALSKFKSAMTGRKRPPFSEEWRKNIGEASKGKKLNLSEEQRRKMSERSKGNKCHLWKGGVTPINKLIRTTMEYKDWRNAIFQRDNWTCQGCGKRGGNMEAHHIKEFSTHPELRYKLTNGITLCKSCHDLTKTGSNKIKKCKDQKTQDVTNALKTSI